MKPYHPANLAYQPYPKWRVLLLAYVGKSLAIQFHIRGIPFGSQKSAYVRPVNECPTLESGSQISPPVFISGYDALRDVSRKEPAVRNPHEGQVGALCCSCEWCRLHR